MNVGDKVYLANKDDRRVSIGRGRVSTVGGVRLFHHEPIPIEYVGVDLEIVLKNTPLLVPVHGVHQLTLDDVVGLVVLWLKTLMFKMK